jgi:hypothetical protein
MLTPVGLNIVLPFIFGARMSTFLKTVRKNKVATDLIGDDEHSAEFDVKDSAAQTYSTKSFKGLNSKTVSSNLKTLPNHTVTDF